MFLTWYVKNLDLGEKMVMFNYPTNTYCPKHHNVTNVSTFYPIIVDCDFDVILLVETWRRDHVLSSEYFSPNYSAHRSYKEEEVMV